MYSSNGKRGTTIMLQSLMVSVKGAVTTFVWGHTEMEATKGEIFAQNLSLECVCIYLLHRMRV